MELKFTYVPLGKPASAYTLADGWEEVGVYVQGYCVESGGFRTFRKDRVLDYLSGHEGLGNPRPAPPPKPRKGASGGPEIVFTGFAAAQKTHLQQLAAEKGMVVRKGVTVGLTYLCAGPTAGPSKLKDAREQGCIICSQAQLYQLWETGELPDDEPECL